MGSCGVRFFSLVFLPYLAGELWIFITNNFKKETIVVDKKRLSLCGEITLFAFIGYIFYRFVLEKQYGPVGTTNAILVNGSEAMENLLYTPGALIEIFGGFLYAGEYIISLEGICQIIILLAVLLIYFLFVYSYYCKDLDEDTKYLRRITFISFIINVFLLAFTSLGKAWGRTLEIHYLGLGICLLMPMVAILFSKIKMNYFFKQLFVIIFIGYLFACDWFLFQSTPNEKPQYVSELEERGYTFGWATDYWKANYTTALTDGRVEMATIQPENRMEMYCWATKRSYRNMTPEFIIFNTDDNIDQVIDFFEYEGCEIYADEQIVVYEVH